MSATRNGAPTPESDTDGASLIAWNLRLLRTRRGYTQDQLAIEAGVDRKLIGWLEGRKGNPTLKMLERLATALAVPLELLFASPKVGSAPPLPLKCGRKRLNLPRNA
jgi:transcriptional regulator with XRE-family HTH domain